MIVEFHRVPNENSWPFGTCSSNLKKSAKNQQILASWHRFNAATSFLYVIISDIFVLANGNCFDESRIFRTTIGTLMIHRICVEFHCFFLYVTHLFSDLATGRFKGCSLDVINILFTYWDEGQKSHPLGTCLVVRNGGFFSHPISCTCVTVPKKRLVLSALWTDWNSVSGSRKK